MNSTSKILSLGFFIFGFSLSAKTFEVDSAHTTVSFKVKHLVISNVEGRFRDVKGTFMVDDATGDLVGFAGSAQAASVDTNTPDRDKHLRSADFFDADKFKEMSFVADKFSVKKGATGGMPGKLTIHGVTKPVTFTVEWNGEMRDPWGNQKAGWSAKIEKLNRREFGLVWNKTLETGGLVVGDDVNINLEVEGLFKGPKDAAAAVPVPTKK